MSLLTVPYCKCARPFFPVYVPYELAFKNRAASKEILKLSRCQSRSRDRQCEALYITLNWPTLLVRPDGKIFGSYIVVREMSTLKDGD
jgi:hypothetical protein